MASTRSAGATAGYDMSLWYDSRPLKMAGLPCWRWWSRVVYQRIFGFSHGVEDREFENVNGVCGALTCFQHHLLAATLGDLETRIVTWPTGPRRELKPVFLLDEWLAFTSSGVLGGSYTLEQDASAQVIIRIRASPPAISSPSTSPSRSTLPWRREYLYAMTGCPVSAMNVSFPWWAIVGPLMILPNVAQRVGHAFCSSMNSSPRRLHWLRDPGCALSGDRGVGGAIVARMSNLCDGSEQREQGLFQCDPVLSRTGNLRWLPTAVEHRRPSASEAPSTGTPTCVGSPGCFNVEVPPMRKILVHCGGQVHFSPLESRCEA